MSKIIKISDPTSLKLKELMTALEEAGCNSEEKLKARKIFKIYLDGKAEITNLSLPKTVPNQFIKSII